MKIYFYITCFLFSLNILSTQANILVTNGLTHQIKTDKGKVYTGSIQVQNIGEEKKNVKIYLQDVMYHSDGTTIYSDPGTNKLTNSNWLSINSNLIELKAGEKFDIKFEIKVPDTITEPGSYSSILMIEPIDISIPKPNDSKGIQIQSVIRYAVQIIADYAIQNTKAEIKFDSINLVNNENQKILKIALANNGKVYCKPTVQLEIFDVINNTKVDAEFKSQSMSLLPNTSKTFPIDITILNKGKYKAIAFAKDEQDNIFALEFELDVE